MTQAIIDNAAAISLDLDTTISQTVSNSRQLKWFRKGPIQHVAEVQMNIVTAETFSPIRGAIQSNLLGPYAIKFPNEVAGVPSESNGTVNGVNQTGTNITVDGYPNSTLVHTAGTLIQFPGVSQVYVVTANVTSNTSGAATIPINYPISSSPTNGGTVKTGGDCVFSMNLVSKPVASFGPTGLVNHDGSFRFTEVF